MENTEKVLRKLERFIEQEQTMANEQLLKSWSRPLVERLQKGLSQRFKGLSIDEDKNRVRVYLDGGESRFREGDLICLHRGDPVQDIMARYMSFEKDDEDSWLLRGRASTALLLQGYEGGSFFADADGMDLSAYYERTINDLRDMPNGARILALFGEAPEISFNEADYEYAEDLASKEGFNDNQTQAIALAYAAEQVACIQGPPGTGKTRVLAFIASLLVRRGERVLITSHSHMAINNALNKVHEFGVDLAKVGSKTQKKGLNGGIQLLDDLSDWVDAPFRRGVGYVIGATPFATCNSRLQAHGFDTIIFDEASQVNALLALMAMRKGQKFIFIGDHKQLPPVILSKSILETNDWSAFAVLTSNLSDHTVMLNETYRLNRWLADWPSRKYYSGKLRAAPIAAERRRALDISPQSEYGRLLALDEGPVFIPSTERSATTANRTDANLIAKICQEALEAGLEPEEIGLVAPYRAQGRILRRILAKTLGKETAEKIVADTVERMQGQERELVILSLVTTDPIFLTIMGEFLFQPQRINVSITRAKSRLIIIGPEPPDSDIFADSHVRQWVDDYNDLIHHCHTVKL